MDLVEGGDAVQEPDLVLGVVVLVIEKCGLLLAGSNWIVGVGIARRHAMAFSKVPVGGGFRLAPVIGP